MAVSTQAATAGSDLNLITAQGIGKVSGTPDVVTIGLGVQTTSTSAQSALDENNKLATDAIAVLKDNGVAPEDLQTSQLSVYPTYGDQGQITGYQVSNMVTAKLRDISKSGAVIDAVGKSAGNAIRVQQLSFAIDDDSAPTGRRSRGRREAGSGTGQAAGRRRRGRPRPGPFDHRDRGAEHALLPHDGRRRRDGRRAGDTADRSGQSSS